MKTQLTFLALSIVLAACASSSANDAVAGSTTSPVAAAKADPTLVIDGLSGTWAFALASSDVAVPLREKCAKSSGSDAARTQACWAEISAEAAREKIRFAKNDAGETVWTSFGSEGSKEIVFVQVPVELAGDGPGHVLAKVSGAPKGDMAAQFAKASINVMRIEIVDARTIAMNDPKKGRLVYTKE